MEQSDNERQKLPGVNERRCALQFEAFSQRAGLIVLLVIIIGALAGLFSNGYLSSAHQVNSTRSVNVNYERFGRLQTDFKIETVISPMDTPQYSVRVGGEFNEEYQLINITPQPDAMVSERNVLVLKYNHVNHHEPFTIGMYVTPTRPGKVVNSITINTEPEVRFWQFIYP